MAPNTSNTSTSTTAVTLAGPSFSLGSWFGVPIQVHSSYFFLVILAVLTMMPHFIFAAYQLLLYGPILFLTIIVHEFGHLFAAKRLGGTPVCIIMWPLGGLALCGRLDPATPKSMALVAAAGPATHILQMPFWVICAFVISLAGTNDRFGFSSGIYGNENVADFFVALCMGAFFLNLSIMLFNLLLPAYPLDGGQIFASVLLMRGCTPEKSGRITSITAMTIATGLGIFALGSLFLDRNPFSTLNLLVALWVGWSSFSLYQLVQAGRVREHPLFNTVAPDNT